MKESKKITMLISKTAHLRLGEMQLTLRSEGVSSDRGTTIGKLVDKLILHPEALKVLKDAYQKP